MELQRQPHHPLHGRAQVMLPDQSVIAGHSQEISLGGVCLLLDDPIPDGTLCTLRFEMLVNGKDNIVLASSKSVYGVFTSHGGFRVWFSFSDQDAQRSALIKALVGNKPMSPAETVDQTEHPVTGL
jgi:hypothetical protein